MEKDVRNNINHGLRDNLPHCILRTFGRKYFLFQWCKEKINLLILLFGNFRNKIMGEYFKII